MTTRPSAHPDPPAHGEDSAPGSSRRRGRRVTVAAFVASGLIHAVAVALYPLLVGTPSVAPPPSTPEEPAARGLEVVVLDEVVTPEPDLVPAQPERELQEPEDPPEPAAAEVAGDPGPEPEPIGPPERRVRSAAEEIRPRSGDPRLDAPLPEELVTPGREWMAQLRLVWALEEMNDSAAVAAAAAASGRDWTYTDAEGRKWGVSPGKLHLGDVTLPLPSFSAPYGSDAARRLQEDTEILRAAIEAATRETLEERARAIRARRDRERANGTPPDTTRGGRGGGDGGRTAGGAP